MNVNSKDRINKIEGVQEKEQFSGTFYAISNGDKLTGVMVMQIVLKKLKIK